MRGLFLSLLALASSLLAIAGAEATLRAYYPALPSLAALEDSDYELVPFESGVDPSVLKDASRCHVQSHIQQRLHPVQRIGAPHLEPELILWVAGDSVTQGMGVGPNQEYGARLATRLAERLYGSFGYRNLGMSGAGFCSIIQRIHDESKGEQPSIVVLGLFADDLESRARLAVQGHLLAFPDRIADPWLRAAASRSYVVNLIWFSATSREEAPARLIDVEGQRLFKDEVLYLQETLASAGAELIVALIPPVGAPDCPDAPTPESRCGWMQDDLALMAGMLEEIGITPVDTRGIWDGRPLLAVEEEIMTSLAIHPNPYGHDLLADALWPSVEEAAARWLAARPHGGQR